jgi:hypothetical protein
MSVLYHKPVRDPYAHEMVSYKRDFFQIIPITVSVALIAAICVYGALADFGVIR